MAGIVGSECPLPSALSWCQERAEEDRKVMQKWVTAGGEERQGRGDSRGGVCLLPLPNPLWSFRTWSQECRKGGGASICKPGQRTVWRCWNTEPEPVKVSKASSTPNWILRYGNLLQGDFPLRARPVQLQMIAVGNHKDSTVTSKAQRPLPE